MDRSRREHRIGAPALLLAALFLLQLSLWAPRISAATRPVIDATWQYSVPLEEGTERRAYLWIPPKCNYVSGVLLGLQNMLERSIFEDTEIRNTIAQSHMAIVWISPGAWPGRLSSPEQPSLKFSPPQDAIVAVQHILTSLAEESGYGEIAEAPILVAGHSAASPFVWGMASNLPDRVFAAIAYKGYIVPPAPLHVPVLYVAQEWAEWGPQWGEVWRKEITAVADERKHDSAALLGAFADLGTGHFDWNNNSAGIVAMFIRKAAAARLSTNLSKHTLKPVDATAGVLVDPATLGTKQYRAMPYREWTADPKTGLWYFDQEMAEAVQRYMLGRLQKKPQAIDFVLNGKPADLVENGFATITPTFLPDGISFRVHAEPLTSSPTKHLYDGSPLGHSSKAIRYRVGSGALTQTGADTFRVAARSGGLARQGRPWEPWILAYQPGDREYRSADKPAHILIDIRNTRGATQAIEFLPIADVSSKTRHINLKASASSGLPIQFYVESGPAEIQGNGLHLLPIPVRSRFPVKVIVSAYQWGTRGDHPTQSTGPVTQSFYIRNRRQDKKTK